MSFFFVLSGFILYYVYERNLTSGRFSTWNFLSARFARIYPVYILGLLLALPGFVVGSLHGSYSDTTYVDSATAAPLLLQAWIPDAACHWNCPGWSLSAEVFFYLLFPVFALLAARIDRRKATALIVLTYVFVLVAPALFVAVGLRADWSDINLNPPLLALRFNPLLRLPEFVLGVLVARVTLANQRQFSPLVFPIAATALVLVLYWSYEVPPRLSLTFVQNGLYAPLFAALIVAIAKSSRPLLANRIWVRLGAASYALYIIHMPIWGMFRFAARHNLIGSPKANLPLYGFYLAIAVGGSLLIHRYVEEPCRYAIRRRLEGVALFARLRIGVRKPQIEVDAESLGSRLAR